MALVYDCAWRVLHALLYLQRTLVSLFRSRLWTPNLRILKRAVAALFFQVTLGFQKHVQKTIQMGPLTSKRDCHRAPWGPDLSSLGKLPLHIGFLIAEEEPCYTDVANLIVWCMAVGISYVSFYDNQGKSQKIYFIALL